MPKASPYIAPRDARRIAVVTDLCSTTVRRAYNPAQGCNRGSLVLIRAAALSLGLPPPPDRFAEKPTGAPHLEGDARHDDLNTREPSDDRPQGIISVANGKS